MAAKDGSGFLDFNNSRVNTAYLTCCLQLRYYFHLLLSISPQQTLVVKGQLASEPQTAELQSLWVKDL